MAQPGKVEVLPDNTAAQSQLRLVSPAGAYPWHWPFESRRLWRIDALKVAALFLALGFMLRVATALSLGLTDDEAWYWALSISPQLSYAVHPPLSMWMIKLSTLFFGDTELGVRMPAIVCSALATFWLVRLVARMGWARGAEATAILCLTAPLLFLGGILSGPDLPLFAFWVGAMETSYALGMGYERGLRSWTRLGVFLAAALLSKYTAALACVATLLWLLSTPEGRRSFRTAGPYLAIAIALSALIPIVAWNAANDWVSFRFQFHDRHAGGEANFRRWGLFWLSQILLFGPVTVAGWFMLLKNAAFEKASLQTRQGLRFLALWAAVPAAVFFVQPIYSDFKIHWALFAWVPVLVYFAKLSASGTHRKLLRRAVSSTFAITALGLACFYFPLASMLGTTFSKESFKPSHDITNDVYGWRLLTHKLRELDQLEKAPLAVVTDRYQIAAQAAFALKDKSRVLLLPHDSAETRDWGGPTELPDSFYYVSDAKYEPKPGERYGSHHCEMLPELEAYRSSQLARQIVLARCKSKAPRNQLNAPLVGAAHH